MKKTSSMQSKRHDLHHTWLHREINEKLSFYCYIFTSLHCVTETSQMVNLYNPKQGRINTFIMRLTCCACFSHLPPQTFPRSNRNKWRVWGGWGEGGIKPGNKADVVWLNRHLCIALQLKKCLPHKHYSACHTSSSPRYMGKVLVKDACLEI